MKEMMKEQKLKFYNCHDIERYLYFYKKGNLAENGQVKILFVDWPNNEVTVIDNRLLAGVN